MSWPLVTASRQSHKSITNEWLLCARMSISTFCQYVIRSRNIFYYKQNNRTMTYENDERRFSAGINFHVHFMPFSLWELSAGNKTTPSSGALCLCKRRFQGACGSSGIRGEAKRDFALNFYNNTSGRCDSGAIPHRVMRFATCGIYKAG